MSDFGHFFIEKSDKKKIKKRTVKESPIRSYRLNVRPGEGKSASDESFSFVVIGDSGDTDGDQSPIHKVTAAMANEDPAFILHVGDVVYTFGAKEKYPERFIQPFRHWLAGNDPAKIEYDEMVFTVPFLPIPGNHDYYDVFSKLPNFSPVAKFLQLLGAPHGSDNGKDFQKAFVNRRARKDWTENSAIDYIPGQEEQTRVPNRYYRFNYGDCAFFALDSNTLNASPANIEELEPDELEEIKRESQQYKSKMKAALEAGDEKEALEYDKKLLSLERRRNRKKTDFDKDQLQWLGNSLELAEDARWKIVYLHHPLYSSEDSHTTDWESVGVRENLRKLFVDHQVDLVLSGHSHCYEVPARRRDGPYADELSEREQNICYVVTGGGGRMLRPSKFADGNKYEAKKGVPLFEDLAESMAYAGTHHYMRIEVSQDSLKVTPVPIDTGESIGDYQKTGRQLNGGQWETGTLSHIEIRKNQQPRTVWSEQPKQP